MKKNQAEKTPRSPAASPDALSLFQRLGKKVHLLLLLLPLAAFALYWPSMEGPFIFDDYPHIRDNVHIRMVEFSPQALSRAVMESPTPARALPMVTLAFNYYFSAYETRGYHIFNVVLHCLAGMALYWFVWLTLTTPWAKNKGIQPGAVPFLAAMLWLVHPLQTQSVAYIVQRMNSMSSLFFITSMALCARGRMAKTSRRTAWWLTLCAVSGVSALLSKQIAVTLPLFILLYEWFFLRDLDQAFIRRIWPALAGVLALAAVIGLLYVDFEPFEHLIEPFQDRDFTLGQRVMTQWVVVVYYVSLLVLPFPSRLNLEYDFPLSTSLWNPPWTILCLALILAALAVAAHQSRRHRLASFCVFWFFGNLALESTVLPLEMVFEHRLYLPSMMAAVLGVLAVRKITGNPKAAIAILAVVMIFFSWGTLQRNKVWADDLLLWADCAEKSPNKARPHYSLGDVYYEREMLADSIRHSKIATTLDPSEPKAWFNLARTLEHPKVRRLDEARKYYEKAVEVAPAHPPSLNALALSVARQGERERAVTLLNQAVASQPDNPTVRLNAGRTLLFLDDPAAAAVHLAKALELDPHYVKALNNLGLAMIQLGEKDKAVLLLSRSVELNPLDPIAQFNLGKLMLEQGKTGQAAFHLKQALQLEPGLTPARKLLNRISS